MFVFLFLLLLSLLKLPFDVYIRIKLLLMFTEVLRITEIFVYVKDFPTCFASVLISHCVSTISFYVVVNTNE